MIYKDGIEVFLKNKIMQILFLKKKKKRKTVPG